MSIYLSHISALEYWSSPNADTDMLRTRAKPDYSPTWRKTAPLPQTCKTTTKDIRLLSEQNLALFKSPLHVLVPHESARSKSKDVAYHVASGLFPRRSFMQIADGVFVSSPELCFVQMATKLPLTRLIMLGYELCGTYGIPTVSRVNFNQTTPLTTPAHIKRYVDAIGSAQGVAYARRALPWLVAGSASPMETILALLLCLPLRLGGYALPAPQMNQGVNPSKRNRFAADDRRYYCDLTWPKANLALEYDSYAYHNGADKKAEDARRRIKLIKRGIEVVSVDGKTVRDLIELDRIAVALSKRLQRRLRRGSPDWQEQQHKLHGALLDTLRS